MQVRGKGQGPVLRPVNMHLWQFNDVQADTFIQPPSQPRHMNRLTINPRHTQQVRHSAARDDVMWQ